MPETETKATTEQELDPVAVIKESLTELLSIAEPAREFVGASGRTYKLTGLNGWTGRQNRAARGLYKKVEKSLGARRAEGEKISVKTVLSALLEEEGLWEDFFSIMYIPNDADRYLPAKAEEYRDDMLDMTNEQAIGALAFFITSSLSSIPRGILTYFREMPMVAAIIEVLETQPKPGASKGSVTASST